MREEAVTVLSRAGVNQDISEPSNRPHRVRLGRTHSSSGHPLSRAGTWAPPTETCEAPLDDPVSAHACWNAARMPVKQILSRKGAASVQR